jgi:hypothetical protein
VINVEQTQSIATYNLTGYDPIFSLGGASQQLTALETKIFEAARKRPVISLLTKLGMIRIGGSRINFTLTPEKAHKFLGQPEHSRYTVDSNQQLEEKYLSRGFVLRYGDTDMSLDEIVVIEKYGCQFEIDGISVFTDDALSRMKARYKYVESKNKRAVAFPTLGVLVVDNDPNNRMAFLCNKETIRFYITTIEMWR